MNERSFNHTNSTQPATHPAAAELTRVKPGLQCDGDFEAPADRPARKKIHQNPVWRGWGAGGWGAMQSHAT